MSVWTNLSPARQLVALLAVALIAAAVWFLAKGAGQRDMTLLFGGLEPSTAGEVIAALDQRGAVYEVRGGAIYVDAAARDNLRMSLAGEGLPATGAQGYELLDGLSGFGTTSQMFDAAYWRAREGELARTILANPAIRAARVHISTPNGRPFQRDQKPTAAVTVTTGGAPLTASQVRALQYLVGAAVTGLMPGDVAIIDDTGGLLSESAEQDSSAITNDRAETLRNRAERLLAARVGPGNAVVEVAIDTVTQTESIVERTVDPESRIAISTDVTESEASSQDSGTGDVTVASNLPDGDAGAGGSASNANSETRALTNFDVSETQRQIVREAGDVRRLTVAVLVNEVAQTAADGSTTFTPRSTEELTALEELVASAVGLDADRGDVITLRSLAFEELPELGTEVSTAPASLPLNIMQLIQVGVLAVVALILGLFVVRPILAGQGSTAAAALPAPDTFEGDSTFEGFEMNSDPMMFDALDTPQLEGPVDDPVARLRDMISERETETVQILQDWMDDPDKKESA